MDGSKMGCSALIPRRVWNAGDDWYWAKLGDRRDYVACHEELRDAEPANSTAILVVGKHHLPEHHLVHTLLYEAGTVIPFYMGKILQ